MALFIIFDRFVSSFPVFFFPGSYAIAWKLLKKTICVILKKKSWVASTQTSQANIS